MTPRVFIGAGAGFAGDRSDAAGPVVDALAKADGPRFLMYETLAERTLALCQLERRKDAGRGYSPALERMLGPVLARCLEDGIKIVGNFGAANPPAAGQRIAEIATSLGLRAPRIAVVEGDDLTGRMSKAELAARETDGTLLAHARDIISANLYLGARPIADALAARRRHRGDRPRRRFRAWRSGPLMHVFGWRADDWDRLAAGTLAGHLLECAAQITGGYFADPGLQGRAGPRRGRATRSPKWTADGDIVITKPPGTGGVVDRLTVTEQLLYEIHDPAAYLAPDVVLDLSAVEVAEIGQGPRARLRRARQAGAGDVEGDRLRRRRRARRGRDFLCRAERGRARTTGRRDHRRAPAAARARAKNSRRCHRRNQHSWRERPRCRI